MEVFPLRNRWLMILSEVKMRIWHFNLCNRINSQNSFSVETSELLLIILSVRRCGVCCCMCFKQLSITAVIADPSLTSVVIPRWKKLVMSSQIVLNWPTQPGLQKQNLTGRPWCITQRKMKILLKKIICMYLQKQTSKKRKKCVQTLNTAKKTTQY